MNLSGFLFLFYCVLICSALNPPLVSPVLTTPLSYTKLRTSGSSALFTIDLPENASYPVAPYLVELVGSRHQIGYDYAALLHTETITAFSVFANYMWNQTEQAKLFPFLDWLFDDFLAPNTPQVFLDELEGMRAYGPQGDLVANISRRFNTIANMPADAVNIIAMLEDELEKGWPDWLKEIVNDIIGRIINGTG